MSSYGDEAASAPLQLKARAVCWFFPIAGERQWSNTFALPGSWGHDSDFAIFDGHFDTFLLFWVSLTPKHTEEGVTDWTMSNMGDTPVNIG